jgi:hypothetical protein
MMQKQTAYKSIAQANLLILPNQKKHHCLQIIRARWDVDGIIKQRWEPWTNLGLHHSSGGGARLLGRRRRWWFGWTGGGGWYL